MDVNTFVQNSLEAMKDNLSSAANIIHVLLNASNRCNIQHITRYTYKHCRWGFMYWLGPKVVSAPLSAQELHAAVLNFVLLYPANMSPVHLPASSPASFNTLSNSEESLATPSAETSALPSIQPANNPIPT
ncbi:hypothetical protein BN14_08715 [Rhizoctonia solani AG-1 IB]|uniref:Uncharacterized protein n=1 Tax=Thanatephorus cucumeris (strain AG1-IB / isolate 7/3/14) TaxID=1108050 RepID=M5C5F2_THACB|nr:hypothetical protein BN14_08715 [Rhizoctonia solani AG-1 IB]